MPSVHPAPLIDYIHSKSSYLRVFRLDARFVQGQQLGLYVSYIRLSFHSHGDTR